MTQIKHAKPYWLNSDYIPGTSYQEYRKQKRVEAKLKQIQKLAKKLRKLNLTGTKFKILTSFQIRYYDLKPIKTGFYLQSNQTFEIFYCPIKYTPDLLQNILIIDC